MPTTSLTEITLRNLKPPEKGQAVYWDSQLRGFGCRVSQGGAKTFLVVHGKERSWQKIGRYPLVSLAQARNRAKEIMAERTLGKDKLPRTPYPEALKSFLASHLEVKCRPSTQREIKRLLNKHLTSLRHRDLEEISTYDLTKIFDKIAAPSEKMHLFAAARIFFRWAVRRKLIRISPLQGLDTPTSAKSRDRVLTDKELAEVLAKARLAGSFGKLVQLLVLTGQRKGEIVGLRADMIDRDGKLVTLPVTKNGRPHTFPYGDMAQAIIETLPEEGLLFPAKGKDTPFNSFSKAITGLREACGFDDWTLHDLRRTFATGLAALGTPIHVTEKLLNHVSGTVSGVAAIYNRHAYLDEMRAAVESWEKHLHALIESA